VTGFLDGFKERDIPLGVFHFDCFWMKSYQWCDFDFDSDMFPDAAGYLKRLKERGLKISVWTNPYVGQASPLFKEGKKNGYFIKVSPTSKVDCQSANTSPENRWIRLAMGLLASRHGHC
jgi:alpha-D-xyloside xylohydrolase